MGCGGTPREFAAPNSPGPKKIQTIISAPEISIGYKQFELRKRQSFAWVLTTFSLL
jgi:hypothetical protein